MELRARRRPRLTRHAAALLAAASALLAAGPIDTAFAQRDGPAAPGSAGESTLRTPAAQDEPPRGYRLTARRAIAAAATAEKIRAARRSRPGLRPVAYLAPRARWQVSWFAGRREVAQAIVEDRSGRVVEAWTGWQVRWRMARGYPGAFGRALNAPYVWIPLCVLFLAPFVDPRRPFRLLHLDLLALLAFGASHVLFNMGEVGWSVPLAYPVLGYLLVRMLAAGLRPTRGEGRLLPLVSTRWLALGLLFLVGFRIGLNVVDSSVIDVGYSGVVGADRIAHGEGLYDGGFPANDRHGDTYGPVSYLAYLPFEAVWPWSGRWDGLPAAHAAAIAFDLLTVAGLLMLGRAARGRGPAGRELGVALAYAWAAFPYTALVLETNANDALIAALLVFALVSLSRPAVRGALLGLAAAAKFAPLALAPLLATAEPGGGRRWLLRGRPRAMIAFTLALGAVLVATFAPFLPDGGLGEVWDRTLGFQIGRESPFSVWGQEPALEWAQVATGVAAAGLAALVAFVPGRPTPAQVAALGAGVLLALQLAATHWFYLYVAWFAPFAFLALFAAYAPRPTPAAEETAAPLSPRARAAAR